MSKAKDILDQIQEAQEKGTSLLCPRCGKPRMNPKLTYNALSRHVDVYVCEVCGMDEAIRAWNGTTISMADWKLPAELFDGSVKPTMKHYTEKEWEKMVRDHPDYTGRWEPSPFNLDRVAAGELPAEYIGRRNLLSYEPGVGTVLLTEGVHFTIGK